MCVSDPDFALCGVVSYCADPAACLLCWNDNGLVVVVFCSLILLCVCVVVGGGGGGGEREREERDVRARVCMYYVWCALGYLDKDHHCR